MSLQEDSLKGHEATRVMENPVVREALDGMREAIHRKWGDSPVNDHAGQHELRLMLKLLNDFEGNLKRFVQDGKMADVEIEAIRKREELQGKVRRFA